MFVSCTCLLAGTMHSLLAAPELFTSEVPGQETDDNMFVFVFVFELTVRVVGRRSHHNTRQAETRTARKEQGHF